MMSELTREEITGIESQRYATIEEAELNANDLANDGCDGEVVEIGDQFAVKVILN